MKNSLILICAAVLLCVCVSAEAEDNPDWPGLWGINPGIYQTNGNTLLPGRMSESWPGDSLDFYVPGNVINIMSWDGDSLGSQWRIWGARPDSDGAVMTDFNFDEYGTGFIDYTVNYTGGSFLFDNTYFGDGTIGLGGWIAYMNIGVKFSYYQNIMTGVTSNILISGRFNNCPGCSFEIAITNALNIWKPGDPDPAPEEYPEFSGDATTGSLWDICCLMLRIDCYGGVYNEPYCTQIGVESSSWGKIKTIYR